MKYLKTKQYKKLVTILLIPLLLNSCGSSKSGSETSIMKKINASALEIDDDTLLQLEVKKTSDSEITVINNESYYFTDVPEKDEAKRKSRISISTVTKSPVYSRLSSEGDSEVLQLILKLNIKERSLVNKLTGSYASSQSSPYSFPKYEKKWSNEVEEEYLALKFKLKKGKLSLTARWINEDKALATKSYEDFEKLMGLGFHMILVPTVHKKGTRVIDDHFMIVQ